MKNIILTILLGVFAFGYFLYTKERDQSCQVVLKYESFGSPVLSSELLGKPFWQWSSAIEDRDAKFDIKVVVYTQSEDLQEIKQSYPVNEQKNEDYRYITFKQVKEYLYRIETEDKEFFNGCRADGCAELEFFDKLQSKVEHLSKSLCAGN